MPRFASDESVWMMVRAFEACSLGLQEFDHACHLATGLAYLEQATFDIAMERMRSSLIRFSAHHGKMGYHETITRFWLLRLAELAARTPDIELWAHCELAAQELGDKDLLFHYYDREVVMGDEARQRWIEPGRSFSPRQ